MCAEGTCRQCRLDDRLTDRAMRVRPELLPKVQRTVKKRAPSSGSRENAERRAELKNERKQYLVWKDDPNPFADMRRREGYWINTHPDAIHGTSNAYNAYNCRCTECYDYEAERKGRRDTPAASRVQEVPGLFR